MHTKVIKHWSDCTFRFLVLKTGYSRYGQSITFNHTLKLANKDYKMTKIQCHNFYYTSKAVSQVYVVTVI